MKLRNLNRNGLVDARGCIQLSPEGCFLAMTPNAYDAPRALHTRMDRPAQVAGIDSLNIYTEPSLDNYRAGSFGSSWARTNNAQITYYVDDSIRRPFFEPVFLEKQGAPEIRYVDYTDPMSSWKSHYELIQHRPNDVSNLSWIVDSTFHRQDLMSKQMAVQNQRRSEPFL